MWVSLAFLFSFVMLGAYLIKETSSMSYQFRSLPNVFVLTNCSNCVHCCPTSFLEEVLCDVDLSEGSCDRLKQAQPNPAWFLHLNSITCCDFIDNSSHHGCSI